MDILGLGFDAVQASHQHGRLDVYHGFNFPSGNTESVTIVINGYDTHNAKFDVEVFDASFKYIVVNPCTKDNWVRLIARPVLSNQPWSPNMKKTGLTPN
ncbi:hypothetical protein ACPSKX_06675 [Moritella viscosa]